MIGPDVGNMIAEAALAMEFRPPPKTSRAPATRIRRSTEAIRQAAMGVDGWTIQA